MTDTILMIDRRSMVHSVMLAPLPVATARKLKLKPARLEDQEKLKAYEAEHDTNVPTMPEIKLKDTNILTGDL